MRDFGLEFVSTVVILLLFLVSLSESQRRILRDPLKEHGTFSKAPPLTRGDIIGMVQQKRKSLNGGFRRLGRTDGRRSDKVSSGRVNSRIGTMSPQIQRKSVEHSNVRQKFVKRKFKQHPTLKQHPNNTGLRSKKWVSNRKISNIERHTSTLQQGLHKGIGEQLRFRNPQTNSNNKRRIGGMLPHSPEIMNSSHRRNIEKLRQTGTNDMRSKTSSLIPPHQNIIDKTLLSALLALPLDQKIPFPSSSAPQSMPQRLQIPLAPYGIAQPAIPLNFLPMSSSDLDVNSHISNPLFKEVDISLVSGKSMLLGPSLPLLGQTQSGIQQRFPMPSPLQVSKNIVLGNRLITLQNNVRSLPILINGGSVIQIGDTGPVKPSVAPIYERELEDEIWHKKPKPKKESKAIKIEKKEKKTEKKIPNKPKKEKKDASKKAKPTQSTNKKKKKKKKTTPATVATTTPTFVDYWNMISDIME